MAFSCIYNSQFLPILLVVFIAQAWATNATGNVARHQRPRILTERLLVRKPYLGARQKRQCGTQTCASGFCLLSVYDVCCGTGYCIGGETCCDGGCCEPGTLCNIGLSEVGCLSIVATPTSSTAPPQQYSSETSSAGSTTGSSDGTSSEPSGDRLATPSEIATIAGSVIGGVALLVTIIACWCRR